MKIKIVHPPFDERTELDLAGYSFLIKPHAVNRILLGQLRFNHDITSESRAEGGDLPIGWGYDVTNGYFDGKVFYKSSEVDVLCMVAEEVEGKL